MGLVEDIETRLRNMGVGSTVGSTWPITLYQLSATENDTIAVVPTGGRQNNIVVGTEEPSFQLLFRAARSNSSGLDDKVYDAISALDGFQGILNDFVYIDIRKEGDILYLGPDPEHRNIISTNWRAVKSTIPECFFFFDAAKGVNNVYAGTFTRSDTATNYIEGGDQTGRLLSTEASGNARIAWFTTS